VIRGLGRTFDAEVRSRNLRNRLRSQEKGQRPAGAQGGKQQLGVCGCQIGRKLEIGGLCRGN